MCFGLRPTRSCWTGWARTINKDDGDLEPSVRRVLRDSCLSLGAHGLFALPIMETFSYQVGQVEPEVRTII